MLSKAAEKERNIEAIIGISSLWTVIIQISYAYYKDVYILRRMTIVSYLTLFLLLGFSLALKEKDNQNDISGANYLRIFLANNGRRVLSILLPAFLCRNIYEIILETKNESIIDFRNVLSTSVSDFFYNTDFQSLTYDPYTGTYGILIILFETLFLYEGIFSFIKRKYVRDIIILLTGGLGTVLSIKHIIFPFGITKAMIMGSLFAIGRILSTYNFRNQTKKNHSSEILKNGWALIIWFGMILRRLGIYFMLTAPIVMWVCLNAIFKNNLVHGAVLIASLYTFGAAVLTFNTAIALRKVLRVNTDNYAVSPTKPSFLKISHAVCYVSFGVCFCYAYIGSSYARELLPFFWNTIIRAFFICCAVNIVMCGIEQMAGKVPLWKILFEDLIFICVWLFMYYAGGEMGDWHMFAFFGMIVGSACLDFDILVFIAFGISTFINLLTFFLSQMGFVFYEVEGIKHAFGFETANGTSIHILIWMMMYFYIRFSIKYKNDSRKLILIDVAVIAICMKFIWSYTCGRTSEVCSLLLCINIVIYELLHYAGTEKWNIVKLLKKAFRCAALAICFIYPVMAVLSFVTAEVYDKTEGGIIIGFLGRFYNTNTLSIRLRMEVKAINMFSPKLFGQVISESTGTDYFLIDNCYIRLFYRCGIGLFFIFLVCMTIAMLKGWRNKRYVTVLILTVIALLGFMEGHPVYFMYDMFPLIWFARTEPDRRNMKQMLKDAV